MKISITQENGFTITQPNGKLNVESVDEFKATTQQLLDEGRSRFIVDLSGLAYLDSSGLGALISLVKRATAKGGSVRFCTAPPLVQNIFELTRLHLVLDLYPSRGEALAGSRRKT